jgi:hypothetical protein
MEHAGTAGPKPDFVDQQKQFDPFPIKPLFRFLCDGPSSSTSDIQPEIIRMFSFLSGQSRLQILKDPIAPVRIGMPASRTSGPAPGSLSRCFCVSEKKTVTDCFPNLTCRDGFGQGVVFLEIGGESGSCTRLRGFRARVITSDPPPIKFNPPI